MAEDRSLLYGFPLPPSWLAALQEFVGTAAPNFHLSLANDHVVQLVAGADSGQVGLGIDGLFRYRSSTTTAAVTGAAGLFDIFAVCGPNDFVTNPTPPPPELDSTDYTFAVQVLAHGTTPTITGSVTNFRLVGQLDWDGSHITGFRPLVGEHSATDPLTPTAPAATLEAVRAVAAPGQSAPIQTWRDSTGAVKALVAADGNISVGGVVLANENDLAVETARAEAAEPTAGELAALAGTSGTPGSGNKYVTDSDGRNTNARTPTAHAASHAAGGSDPIIGAWQALTSLHSGIISLNYAVGGRLEHGDTVRLHGMMFNNGSTIGANTLLAVLPAGLRPSAIVQDMQFPVAFRSGGVMSLVALRIDSSGQLWLEGGAFANGQIVYLDGVTFTLT